MQGSETKFCPRCKQHISIDDFSPHKRSKDGLYTYCRKCASAYNMERYNKNKEHHKKLYTKYTKMSKPNISEKYCSKCNETKTIDKFSKNSYRKDGYNGYCKVCLKIMNQKYNKSNKGKTKRKITNDKLREAGKFTEYNKKYYSSEKGKAASKRGNDKKLGTIQGKLHNNISSLFRQRLKKRGLSKDGKSTFDFVSWTVQEAREHLEKQFLPGMSWENHGKNGWEMDHIIPESLWSYETTEDFDLRKCWSLENLRPMWAKENTQKGNNLFWDLENPDKGYPLPGIIEWFCNYKGIEVPEIS